MNIFFIGGASQAKLCQHILQSQGHLVTHVYDAKGDVHLPGKCFKSSNESDITSFAQQCDAFLVCIGGDRGFQRAMWSQRIVKIKPAINAISPAAFIGDTVVFGRGLQAMPHVVINQFSQIGDWCILNTNCTVDHECIVGNGVHIMGGAALAGKVIVGDFSTIGTNATILPDIKIGSNVFIGAGAVVTKDVPDNAVMVGSPARVLRLLEPVEKRMA
jgi:sugar O-acyltransferase (sialic acid O-acetyltransferase NeuD family)